MFLKLNFNLFYDTIIEKKNLKIIFKLVYIQKNIQKKENFYVF